MNHVEAREALLIAEPHELRGIGDSPLAEHIRNCAQCRAAASGILLVTDGLAAQLNAAAGTAKRPTRSYTWPVWIALPLAAAISGIMLVSGNRDEFQPPRVGSIAEVKRPVTTPVVNAPANRNVAVFKATENITVVWDLGSKGGS